MATRKQRRNCLGIGWGNLEKAKCGLKNGSMTRARSVDEENRGVARKFEDFLERYLRYKEIIYL